LCRVEDIVKHWLKITNFTHLIYIWHLGWDNPKYLWCQKTGILRLPNGIVDTMMDSVILIQYQNVKDGWTEKHHICITLHSRAILTHDSKMQFHVKLYNTTKYTRWWSVGFQYSLCVRLLTVQL